MGPDQEDREEVILVDADDRPIGRAPKLAAHRDGWLHRAVSVQLRDGEGRLLLQKRRLDKYHSGGLWTNTCCGHPRPGESVAVAARRRLDEEMGIRCELLPLFTATYRADVDRGLIEHELVHVFGGEYSGEVHPHPEEAEAFAWVAPDDLIAAVARTPEQYSVWFRIYLRDHGSALTGRA
jgi:isopentenyl-diphosphate delta-isomerase